MTHLFAIFLALTLAFTVLGCDAEKESNPSRTPTAAQTKSTLIDINRASADELMALKGIGKVRAMAIVRGRPYSRKDELVQRGIIPPAFDLRRHGPGGLSWCFEDGNAHFGR